MSAGNHLSAFPSDDPLSLELSHPRDPVAGAPPLQVGQRQCHEAPEQPAPQFGIDPIGACAKQVGPEGPENGLAHRDSHHADLRRAMVNGSSAESSCSPKASQLVAGRSPHRLVQEMPASGSSPIPSSRPGGMVPRCQFLSGANGSSAPRAAAGDVVRLPPAINVLAERILTEEQVVRLIALEQDPRQPGQSV
jgi:hypothetical protein